MPMTTSQSPVAPLINFDLAAAASIGVVHHAAASMAVRLPACGGRRNPNVHGNPPQTVAERGAIVGSRCGERAAQPHFAAQNVP